VIRNEQEDELLQIKQMKIFFPKQKFAYKREI